VNALHERFTLLLARIGPSATACATPDEEPGRADRAAHSAAAGEHPGRDSGERDARGHRQARSPVYGTRVAPPAARTRIWPTLSAPTGGLRGLAALGRPVDGGSASRSDSSAEISGDARNLRSAIDADELADLLRREAERSGIDLAGLEP
jgi:hypothetical protein